MNELQIIQSFKSVFCILCMYRLNHFQRFLTPLQQTRRLFKNIVPKGEHSQNEQFLILPQMFKLYIIIKVSCMPVCFQIRMLQMCCMWEREKINQVPSDTSSNCGKVGLQSKIKNESQNKAESIIEQYQCICLQNGGQLINPNIEQYLLVLQGSTRSHSRGEALALTAIFTQPNSVLF